MSMEFWTFIIDAIGNLGLPVGLLLTFLVAIKSLWTWIQPKLDALFERGNKAIDSHIELVDKLRLRIGEIGTNQEIIAQCSERTTQTLREVTELVQRHDSTQRHHHDACIEAGKRVDAIHSAALVACDKAESIARRHDVDLREEINEIREALKS
jgi:hypothetical protein